MSLSIALLALNLHMLLNHAYSDCSLYYAICADRDNESYGEGTSLDGLGAGTIGNFIISSSFFLERSAEDLHIRFFDKSISFYMFYLLDELSLVDFHTREGSCILVLKY